MAHYTERLRNILNAGERKFFSQLSTPNRVQDYLDSLPVNFELGGETYMSVRRTMQAGTAHCFEGALLAAAAFTYHGHKPLLMDLGTVPADEDHVVALFQINGYWGATSKTNHAVLRYRDPVYASVREVAMSYFNEYFAADGSKSLRLYSAPFNLSKYAPEKWFAAPDELHWLVERLDSSRHFPAVPKKNLRSLRRASNIEMHSVVYTEWNNRGVKKKFST